MKDKLATGVLGVLAVVALLIVAGLAVLFYGALGLGVAYLWNTFAVPSYDVPSVIWWHVAVGLWVVAVLLKAVVPSRG